MFAPTPIPVRASTASSPIGQAAPPARRLTDRHVGLHELMARAVFGDAA